MLYKQPLKIAKTVNNAILYKEGNRFYVKSIFVVHKTINKQGQKLSKRM